MNHSKLSAAKNRPNLPVGSDHTGHSLVPEAAGELSLRELFLENDMHTLNLEFDGHASEMIEQADLLAPSCSGKPLAILVASM